MEAMEDESRWHEDANERHGRGSHMCMKENFPRTGEAREKRTSMWGEERSTLDWEVKWEIRLLRKMSEAVFEKRS